MITDYLKLPRLKELIRKTAGDNVTSWLHGARYVYRLRTVRPEADLALLHLVLSDGDVAIDVGANGADWSVAMSKLCGTNGRVFAFEADPYYALVTKRALRLLRVKNVEFFSFGLSDKNEETRLRVVLDDGVRTSGRGYVSPDANASDTVPITLVTLDSLVATHPPLAKTKVLKCDVEGYELKVLLGSSKVLESRPIIICEVGHEDLHGAESDSLTSWLLARGHEMFVVGSDLSSLEPCRVGDAIDELSRPNRWFVPTELTGDPRLKASIRRS